MIQLHHHLLQSLILVTSISLIDLIISSRFMPLNGDIAGLMVRTSEEQFPWFSPAVNKRGNINNTVKLAYNPKKFKEIFIS